MRSSFQCFGAFLRSPALGGFTRSGAKNCHHHEWLDQPSYWRYSWQVITVAQAAKKLRLSETRLRQLLLEGRIVGAQHFGPVWAIPDKPVIHPPLKIKHRQKRKETSR